MDLDFTEEQDMLREMVRGLVRDHRLLVQQLAQHREGLQQRWRAAVRQPGAALRDPAAQHRCERERDQEVEGLGCDAGGVHGMVTSSSATSVIAHARSHR